MKYNDMKYKNKKKVLSGVSLIEVIISIAVFSFIALAVVTLFYSTNTLNLRSKVGREVQENGRRIMDAITYEIRNAKSVYTSTTTSSQLSLETYRYLPSDETSTFIDFFLCGTGLCLKKESQNPIILNPSTIEVNAISFTHILTSSAVPSVQINLTVKYKNPNNESIYNKTYSLTSTASLRSY